MPFEGILSVAVVAGVIAALITNRVAVETAMLAGLVALVLLRVVDPAAALSGFAHPAVITIAALFVVAAGLRETGATVAAAPLLLGRPKTIASAQFRLMAPVAVLSAFINNTPVVAMYLPLVRDWANRIRVSPSKLLIPLSFASILGGQLTLIGSASNLIVMGLYLEHLEVSGLAAPSHVLKFWGPALLGLPAALVGITYLMGASRVLIPDRLRVPDDPTDVQEYTVQMDVLSGFSIASATIESSGLLQLPGLHLFEIERDGEVLEAPPPELRLRAGDRLGLTGTMDSVVDLQRVRGLAPPERRKSGVTDPGKRELVEAVVAAGSPLAGHTVREMRFRTLFHAAVVAVRHRGDAVRSRIGDIRLEAGDTLLLEAPKGFAHAYRSSNHFYLVSAVPDFAPPRHDRLRRAVTVFCLLIAGLLAAPWEPVVVCLAAALLMVCLGCVRASRALTDVSLQVIVAIAAALGMSAALEQSGAAQAIATWLLDTSSDIGLGNRGMLFVMMLTGSAFAQVITKNGAAALMFPIAKATADELNLHLEPFAFSLIFGCGLSFLSPVAYQTNLMVYGPGGYRFLDFPRIGAPLTILLAALGALLCPLVFPFRQMP